MDVVGILRIPQKPMISHMCYLGTSHGPHPTRTHLKNKDQPMDLLDLLLHLRLTQDRDLMHIHQNPVLAGAALREETGK
jgi:hypothetical protein